MACESTNLPIKQQWGTSPISDSDICSFQLTRPRIQKASDIESMCNIICLYTCIPWHMTFHPYLTRSSVVPPPLLLQAFVFRFTASRQLPWRQDQLGKPNSAAEWWHSPDSWPSTVAATPWSLAVQCAGMIFPFKHCSQLVRHNIPLNQLMFFPEWKQLTDHGYYLQYLQW